MADEYAQINVGTLTQSLLDQITDFINGQSGIDIWSIERDASGATTLNFGGTGALSDATAIANRLTTITGRSVTSSTRTLANTRVITARDRRNER